MQHGYYLSILSCVKRRELVNNIKRKDACLPCSQERHYLSHLSTLKRDLADIINNKHVSVECTTQLLPILLFVCTTEGASCQYWLQGQVLREHAAQFSPVHLFDCVTGGTCPQTDSTKQRCGVSSKCTTTPFLFSPGVISFCSPLTSALNHCWKIKLFLFMGGYNHITYLVSCCWTHACSSVRMTGCLTRVRGDGERLKCFGIIRPVGRASQGLLDKLPQWQGGRQSTIVLLSLCPLMHILWSCELHLCFFNFYWHKIKQLKLKE